LGFLGGKTNNARLEAGCPILLAAQLAAKPSGRPNSPQILRKNHK